jgi:hypothetical protein
MPMVSSTVATGRRTKGSERFMRQWMPGQARHDNKDLSLRARPAIQAAPA